MTLTVKNSILTALEKCGYAMKRKIEEHLENWLENKQRKPLILRGARQVGKTWLVRNLAKVKNKNLFEINFERNLNAKSLFESNDPTQIIKTMEVFFEKKILPQNSIVFLDEIQSAKEVLPKLRWFAEEMPELAVIAAGSLLEFLLLEHEFSMPVGRVNFMYVEPLSFDEFLLAKEKNILHSFLTEFSLKKEMPLAIHTQALEIFKEYMLIGGMPAAVTSWCHEESFAQVSQVHQDLLATYRADFAKYRGKIALERLEEAMASTPRLLGQKFVFSQVNPNVTSESIKQAIRLLNHAALCHSVIATSANGLPLAAEKKDKFFKEIFLDVGLVSSALGMSYINLKNAQEINLVNNGALAEQVVGQLLRCTEPFFIKPELYYWLRDEKGSQAEIDYVIQNGQSILPIEVKAGSEGTLKSLIVFMKEKKLTKAVKISSAMPKISQRDFTLYSIPLYLTEHIRRLVS